MVSPLDFTLKALKYLSAIPHCSILDVGCGDGRDSLHFAENGLKVTAIDFSDEAIGRVKAADKGIDARVMDILEMDFEDAEFDAVYAHLSIQYFDDATTDQVIANIKRMLKPGGYFFIKCKSVEDPLFGQGEKVGENMFKRKYVRHFFTEEYMREKLKDFQILELQSTQAQYDGHKSAFVEAVGRKG